MNHIAMQSDLQEFVDSGISKTVNLNKEATLEEVKNVYLAAYSSRCKGITVYRDGSRDMPVYIFIYLNLSMRGLCGL